MDNKEIQSSKVLGNEILTPISGTAKKAADKLIVNPASDLSQALSENIFTKFSIIRSIENMNYTDPKELVIVVDKDDHVLEHLPRKEAHDKKLLHRTISVLIFNDEGKVVLQKRSLKKDSNPGKWSNATGGHVGKNEIYDEAARREISEELNLDITPKLFKKMIINDPAHTTMTCLYTVSSNGPFKFNPEETDEIKFFSKGDLHGIFDQLSESSKITLKEYGFLK